MKFFAVLLLLAAASAGAYAQSYEDVCHVYVVDVAKARHALNNFHETGNEGADAKALAVGQTRFSEFRTTFNEEELTTKYYPFPGSKLIITASVFYTDESMASNGEGEFAVKDQSMLIGVSVSSKPRESALTDAAPNSAIAEATWDQHLHTTRAKQYVIVNRRTYLVGIECSRSKK